MILLKLAPRSASPLYAQIIDQIRSMIESGVLKEGTPLPATRSLSKSLGVNRATVYKAYQELWALGYLESRPGSYTFIRKRRELTTGEKKKPGGVLDWEKLSVPSIGAIRPHLVHFRKSLVSERSERMFDFASMDLDERLFPIDDFRRCLSRILVRENARIFKYGDFAGYRPLREFIAEMLRVHGIDAETEEILITSGSNQGIELMFKLSVTPGSRVAIESPTYTAIYPLIRLFQAEAVPIPMRREGMDLGALRREIRQGRPAFVYTIPNFQNPTGVTTSQAHREELLSICEENRIPLLEDAFDEEMKYFGKAVLPIKSMDKNQVVIYLGTFSKILCPGARIGWVAAEKECIERLMALKMTTDITSNSLAQAALHEFCRQGHYELHLKKMSRIFSRRMRAALKALKTHLPKDAVEFCEPDGGFLLWIRLKHLKGKAADLYEEFGKAGVTVTPGHFFYLKPPHETSFRLSISTMDEKQIIEGIRRIGAVLRRLAE